MGAGSGYIQAATQVEKEMREFDGLSPKDQLAKGRVAYEAMRWRMQTRVLERIAWATLGGMIVLAMDHFHLFP